MNTAVRLADFAYNDYLEELRKLRIPKRKKPYKYASLFCGGGGLDLGFSLDGFSPAYSSDIVPKFAETVQKNLGHYVEAADVSKISGTEIVDKAKSDIDVLIGGPPCQSFSILGSRGSIDDPRGQLVYDYARIVAEVKPKAFLLENVPGIMTVNRGQDWKDMLQFFHEKTGFHLVTAKLNSADYGVPQIRNRIIMIGFREFRDREKFKWPEATHSDPLKNQIINLPPYRHSALALDDVHGLPNHVLRVHCDRVRDRYSLIEPGGRDRKDHTDRIHPDRPSGTVLVGSGAGGGRPFIHPVEHRHITVREAARLQSFPDWWEFHGGPTAAYRQVGNAVPPLLAKAVAAELARALSHG